MEHVYIIDLIGRHSGMHYYHSAFIHLFDKDDQIKFQVLSNYNSSRKAFFKNIFTGSKIVKLSKLATLWTRLLFFILFNRNAHFVYLSYGQKIDRPFLWLARLNKSRFCVDIHEVYDIGTSLSEADKKKMDNCYRKSIKYVISHSESTMNRLSKMCYTGTIFQMPHVRYLDFKKSSTDTIPLEIKHAFKTDRINILFFGHIRLSKGIIELFEMFNHIENTDLLDKVNIIIAGNDTNNIIAGNSLQFNSQISNSLILRYITDEEMSYIYSSCDYCILPYTEISQSGVVEMAVRFRKPLLLSDLPEFRRYLNLHSSFGHIFELNNQAFFEDILNTLKPQPSDYYTLNDLEIYKDEIAFQSFTQSFKSDFIKK